MAPKFVINGLRNSKHFMADLTSKEYAARNKAKRSKKIEKLMEKADKRRNIKLNGLADKLRKKKKVERELTPVAKI